MERLECSVVQLSRVNSGTIRFDTKYYSKSNIKLEEIIAKKKGKTVGEHNGVVDCSAFYPSITGYYSDDRKLVPFLRVNEINNGLIVLTDKTVFLPQKVLEDNPTTISVAYPEDIIIAKGGNTLAKVGLVTDEYPMYATCRDVIILRTNMLENINKYYLWSFLHSNYGQDLMWRSASQTGQPHITLPIITNMHIPEYSKSFQDEVENLYEASVQKKNKSDEKYKEAENMLMKELGFDKWEPSNNNISIRFFSDIQRVERFDSEYFLPQYDELVERLNQYGCRPLNLLVNTVKSIEPGSNAYLSEGVPFYRVADVSKEGLKEPNIFLDEKKYYSDELSFKKDMILFSKDGSIGIAYKIEEDMKAISSGALLHFVLKDKSVLADYLTLVLNSCVVAKQAERDAGGSIIQHWRPEEIEKVLIPIANDKIQKKITEAITESFKLRKESNALLEKAKKAVELAIETSEEKAVDLLKCTQE